MVVHGNWLFDIFPQTELKKEIADRLEQDTKLGGI